MELNISSHSASWAQYLSSHYDFEYLAFDAWSFSTWETIQEKSSYTGHVQERTYNERWEETIGTLPLIVTAKKKVKRAEEKQLTQTQVINGDWGQVNNSSKLTGAAK